VGRWWWREEEVGKGPRFSFRVLQDPTGRKSTTTTTTTTTDPPSPLLPSFSLFLPPSLPSSGLIEQRASELLSTYLRLKKEEEERLAAAVAAASAKAKAPTGKSAPNILGE